MTLGERIGAVIAAKGLKQVLVAHDAGITQGTLSNIIRGETKQPKFRIIVAIARAIGEPVSALVPEPAQVFLKHERKLIIDAFRLIEERALVESAKDLGQATEPLHLVPEVPAAATPDMPIYPPDIEELSKHEIPNDLYRRGVRRVFKTLGESMVEAGIYTGDILYVDTSIELRSANRRIGVCLLDGSPTVKRIELTPRGIRLLSENPRNRPRIVDEDADRFKFIGVVIARLGYF